MPIQTSIYSMPLYGCVHYLQSLTDVGQLEITIEPRRAAERRPLTFFERGTWNGKEKEKKKERKNERKKKKEIGEWKRSLHWPTSNPPVEEEEEEKKQNNKTKLSGSSWDFCYTWCCVENKKKKRNQFLISRRLLFETLKSQTRVAPM